MFDMHLDEKEVIVENTTYCGHCIAKMNDRGGFLECPVCSSKCIG